MPASVKIVVVVSALLVEAEALRDDIRIIPEGTTEHIMLEIS
jgi:hypothetical protein